MVYKIIGFILITTLLSGCLQNSELDKMTNKEIEQYFVKNKKELKHIINICEKHPSIKRVEKDDSQYYLKNISMGTKKAVKDIQKIVIQLKIDNIQCGRNEQILNNELFGVSFWLYSAGLGVSGEGQYINYETKKARKRWEKKEKNNIPWETIFPLPSEGWSIVQTK
jgi:ribosomal protein L7Ae-like RNA K-turn-binding protein